MASLGKIVSAFVLFFFLLGIAHGQTSTGSLSGVITDQHGSLIARASVTIRSTATGFARSTSTDSEGHFTFLDLPVGPYKVTIEAPTFPTYVRTGIQLLVNQNAVVNSILPSGIVTAVVTVNSDASLLNTTTPEVATQFDARRLSELPLASDRNVYDVLLSVPGVSPRASGLTA